MNKREKATQGISATGTNAELVLEVTVRNGGGYRLRAFEGDNFSQEVPVPMLNEDYFDRKKPVPGFEDADFSVEPLKKLAPLLPGRPRVRLVYDPSSPHMWDLNRRPLEAEFARRGISLVRHPYGTGFYTGEMPGRGKVKVLLIYANPDPAKSSDKVPHLPYLLDHVNHLERALDELSRNRAIVLDKSLRNDRKPLTKRRILEKIPDFDIVIYVGHGGYPSETLIGGGLEWGNLDEETLPFSELKRVLEKPKQKGPGKKHSLRLLVMVACYSGQAAGQLWKSDGIGAEELPVPAVIGMEGIYPASEVAAFCGPFFSKISKQLSIEEAFKDALMEMDPKRFQQPPGPIAEWAKQQPRLWLTARHSRLFPDPGEWAKGLYLEKLYGRYGQVEVSSATQTTVPTVPLAELYVDQVVSEPPKLAAKDTRREREQEESIFVEPEVVSSLKGQATQPTERIVVDLWQALEERRRVLLLAGAQTGKSTLCRHVVMECEQQTGWIPIFVHFPDFSRTPKSLQDFIQQDVAGGLCLAETKVLMGTKSAREVPLGEWLYSQWENGNALLVIDSIDEEFNETCRNDALARIPLITDRQKTPRVLFTSRPIGGKPAPAVYILDLQEFEKEHQIRECVENCARVLEKEGYEVGERISRFLKILADDHRRRLLARRPGQLVEMFVLFVENGEVAGSEEELMTWVSEKRLKLTGRTKFSLDPDEPEDRRQILEEVCFHLLLCREKIVLPRREILLLIKTAKGSTQVSVIPQTHILNDLIRNSGFLRETKVEGKPAVKVESALWLQYFAACHVAREIPKDGDVARWVQSDEKTSESTKENAGRRATGSQETGLYCPICHTTRKCFSHYLWRKSWHDLVLMVAGKMDDATLLLERIEQEPDDLYRQQLVLCARTIGRARKVDVGVAHRVCLQLVEVWRSDEHWTDLELAFVGLGSAKDERYTEPLLRALEENLRDNRRMEKTARVFVMVARGFRDLDWGDGDPVAVILAGLKAKAAADVLLVGNGGYTSMAAAFLVAALKEDDYTLRRWATETIVWTVNRSKLSGLMIDTLLGATRSADPALHREVLNILAEIVDMVSCTEKLVDSMVLATQDKDPCVRTAAVESLSKVANKIGAPTTVVNTLVSTLSSLKGYNLQMAVIALAEVIDKDGVPEAMADSLVTILEDEILKYNSGIYWAYEEVVQKLGMPKVADVLILALRSNYRENRRIAMRMLEEVVGKSSISDSTSDALLQQLRAALRDNDDWAMWDNAVSVLVKVADVTSKHEQVANILLMAVEDMDQGGYWDEDHIHSIVPALVTIVDKIDGSQEAVGIVRRLMECLVRGLEDQTCDDKTRIEVVWALADIMGKVGVSSEFLCSLVKLLEGTEIDEGFAMSVTYVLAEVADKDTNSRTILTDLLAEKQGSRKKKIKKVRPRWNWLLSVLANENEACAQVVDELIRGLKEEKHNRSCLQVLEKIAGRVDKPKRIVDAIVASLGVGGWIHAPKTVGGWILGPGAGKKTADMLGVDDLPDPITYDYKESVAIGRMLDNAKLCDTVVGSLVVGLRDMGLRVRSEIASIYRSHLADLAHAPFGLLLRMNDLEGIIHHLESSDAHRSIIHAIVVASLREKPISMPKEVGYVFSLLCRRTGIPSEVLNLSIAALSDKAGSKRRANAVHIISKLTEWIDLPEVLEELLAEAVKDNEENVRENAISGLWKVVGKRGLRVLPNDNLERIP